MSLVVVTMNISTSVAALITSVADATLTDRRSVERALLGLPVRGKAGQRIATEFARRGVRPVALAAPTASSSPLERTEESAAE
jgi:hypothetical protein